MDDKSSNLQFSDLKVQEAYNHLKDPDKRQHRNFEKGFHFQIFGRFTSFEGIKPNEREGPGRVVPIPSGWNTWMLTSISKVLEYLFPAKWRLLSRIRGGGGGSFDEPNYAGPIRK